MSRPDPRSAIRPRRSWPRTSRSMSLRHSRSPSPPLPLAAPRPLDVAFNSRVTGGIGPYSYAWSFGDGSTSEDPDIEHRYARSGRYNVTLEVTDSVGTRSEASVTVTVMAAQMIATILSTATNGRSPLNTALSAEVAGGRALFVLMVHWGRRGFHQCILLLRIS